MFALVPWHFYAAYATCLVELFFETAHYTTLDIGLPFCIAGLLVSSLILRGTTRMGREMHSMRSALTSNDIDLDLGAYSIKLEETALCDGDDSDAGSRHRKIAEARLER
ncbi:hypothetical protein CYLTODRAFT_422200, partial [Cylindrobasidium torrendii FP15055 ss-10]